MVTHLLQYDPRSKRGPVRAVARFVFVGAVVTVLVFSMTSLSRAYDIFQLRSAAEWLSASDDQVERSLSVDKIDSILTGYDITGVDLNDVVIGVVSSRGDHLIAKIEWVNGCGWSYRASVVQANYSLWSEPTLDSERAAPGIPSFLDPAEIVSGLSHRGDVTILDVHTVDGGSAFHLHAKLGDGPVRVFSCRPVVGEPLRLFEIDSYVID